MKKKAPAPPPEEPRPRSIAGTILFRFALCYFVLFAIPFPVNYIWYFPPQIVFEKEWVSEEAAEKIGKAKMKVSEHVIARSRDWWDEGVKWTAKQPFLDKDVSTLPRGSGDTTWNYVQVLLRAALAAGLTLIWSLIDRRRRRYAFLGRWFHVAARYLVGLYMTTYGFIKLFPNQMPFPTLTRMLMPYGDASPMGVVWRFMGTSPAYESFTGVFETLAGLLLFWRRTSTLGALLAAGAMLNVAMMNYCFDVPVKLLSTHLLVFALAIALPDTKRLLSFFLLHRPAPPGDLSPHFRLGFLRGLLLVVKVVFLGCILWGQGYGSYQRYTEREHPPLWGIYDVQEFTVDGETLPPLMTDARRWRNVVIDWPGTVNVRNMPGAFRRRPLKVSEDEATLTIGEQTWTREEAPDGFETWRGTLDGKEYVVRLKRRPDDSFLLENRGFHWINERPYHR